MRWTTAATTAQWLRQPARASAERNVGRARADLLRGGEPGRVHRPPNGSIDFFPVDQSVLDFIAEEFPETLPSHVRPHLGVTAPGTRFDTVLMGRATYAPALQAGITSPYAHLRQYVASTTL